MTAHGFWAPPSYPFVEIRTTQDSAQSYAPHFHDSFSIGLILDGETDFTCNGVTHRAKTGDIVLIEAMAAHSCNKANCESRSYHMLHVDPALWGGARLLPKNRLVQDTALFETLRCSIERACLGQTKTGEPGLDQTILDLIKMHCATQRPPTPPEPIGRAMGMMSDAQDRLAVAELAKCVGFGREGFIRAFRRNLGLTPGVYQHCARLAKARRLLRSGVGVAETAFSLGYADQSHFHRMFVKYFAATPRQYQKNRSLSCKT